MNESLSHNKISFYEKKEPHVLFGFWISVILSLAFFLSCTLKIRLSSEILAIYQSETNTLVIVWPLSEIDKISQYEMMQIETTYYPFQIKSRNELLVDEKTQENVQKIEIESPRIFQDNQVLQIYLLDKKEQIIKKIKTWIQGG